MQDATESNLGAAVNRLSMLTPLFSWMSSLVVTNGLLQGELVPASLVAAVTPNELAKSSGNSSKEMISNRRITPL
jgi:hypothetical protein